MRTRLRTPNPGSWTPLQSALIAIAYLGTIALAGWLGYLAALVGMAVPR